MTLTTKDASILAQVAFKGAVEAGDDVTTEEGQSSFITRLAYYKEVLFDYVKTATTEYAPQATTVPTPAPARTAEQALEQELGAAPLIEVVSEGGKQGDFPAWFVKAAAEAGVNRVYDNRAGLGENPKLPWFKCADTKKPFWPPKSKGGK